MNELDFFVTCVGIFKMAKPSRMNRHFEISETNDIKMVQFQKHGTFLQNPTIFT